MVSTLMVALLLGGSARADVITLDNGSVLVGDLGMYQFGGDCHVTVTEGPLLGVAVTVPCRRVARFERSNPNHGNVAVPLPPDPGPPPEAAAPGGPVSLVAAPVAPPAAVAVPTDRKSVV